MHQVPLPHIEQLRREMLGFFLPCLHEASTQLTAAPGNAQDEGQHDIPVTHGCMEQVRRGCKGRCWVGLS